MHFARLCKVRNASHKLLYQETLTTFPSGLQPGQELILVMMDPCCGL